MLSIKDSVLRTVRFQKPAPTPSVHTLKGIDLVVNDGERLGIIGHNGAGKSSLLRVLAGVYPPTEGSCTINGKINSIFELGLGFEADATGWENIRYRGYLQRETAKTIKDKMQAIADFSELGSALDRPLKTYSSGMIIRLAFSIATTIEPEILLLDEVIGAGDLAFIEKARARMRQLMNQAKAIVLVAHALPLLREICDRVIWMDQGIMRMDGKPNEVIDAYTAYMKDVAAKKAAA
jgi:ABC-type polysaccharide/polyol phosphate transport system ATPase subunit